MMVVGPDGDIYCCGSGSNGQLGAGRKQNLLTPTLVTVATPPLLCTPELGTSVDPEDVVPKQRYLLKRVFTGGDQTFATFAISEEVWREGGRGGREGKEGGREGEREGEGEGGREGE